MSIIRLKPIVEATLSEKTAFGSRSGQKSLRRFEVKSEVFQRLLNGPFKNYSHRELPEYEKIYRLAEKRRSKSRGAPVEYEIIVPRKSERSSKDSWNTYTVLLSKLPSWAGWPKRSHSVIFFVGSIKTDTQYGSHIYRLIPKNGAKIAVSTHHDILEPPAWPHMRQLLSRNGQFIDITVLCQLLGRMISWAQVAKKYKDKAPNVFGSDLNDLKSQNLNNWVMNVRLENYAKLIKLLDASLNQKTLPQIKNALDSAFTNSPLGEWQKNRFLEYKETFEFYANLVEKYGGWENLLSEALDPVKNGFELMTAENVRPNHNKSCEAWTDDACLMKYDKGNF